MSLQLDSSLICKFYAKLVVPSMKEQLMDFLRQYMNTELKINEHIFQEHALLNMQAEQQLETFIQANKRLNAELCLVFGKIIACKQMNRRWRTQIVKKSNLYELEAEDESDEKDKSKQDLGESKTRQDLRSNSEREKTRVESFNLQSEPLLRNADSGGIPSSMPADGLSYLRKSDTFSHN